MATGREPELEEHALSHTSQRRNSAFRRPHDRPSSLSAISALDRTNNEFDGHGSDRYCGQYLDGVTSIRRGGEMQCRNRKSHPRSRDSSIYER